MSRTARLLELMITVRSRPRFTVQEMAEEFGVSRRTMLRDLHALSEMGVPLAASPGPGGGYQLIARERLLPLSLSVDEAIGVILSYEAMLRYTQSPFGEQSRSAVSTIRNALPADVVRELDRMREHVAVTAPTPSYDAPFLRALLEAAVESIYVRIVYDSRSGVSERVVFPYGLFAAQGFWYCLCHDERRGMPLALRADRVRSLERVEGGDKPAPLSLREWLAHRYELDGTPSFHLRARVNRRGARSFEMNTLFGEIPLDEDGTGVIECELPISELGYFAERFLAVGTDVVVESPPEFIAELRRRAGAIDALYAGSL